jgi:hypothetical protein
MTFHERLAFELLAVQVILGVWALVLGLRGAATGRVLGYALIIDEGLLILQSVVGGLLFAGGERPQLIHFLYGGLLVALLPVIYPLSRRRPERSGYWLGFTLLFMAGLIIRAAMTGRS